jgi:CDP-L-myo-inositol myo-inositolphosphotransferase
VSKPQDGFASRFLNRPISRRLTRFLLKFPIHPSVWTISIFVLPLIACVFFVRGDYLSVVIGATIFQAFSILDGCDGEIARARNLESKFENGWINSAIFSKPSLCSRSWPRLHRSVKELSVPF